MELWIRSQDKKKLCVAKFFELDNDETGIFCFNGESYSIFAGKYKTKERTLEVLDEIHQRLIDLQTIEIAPDSYKTIKRNIDCVYEMPKD